jgi:hypothetical protein
MSSAPVVRAGRRRVGSIHLRVIWIGTIAIFQSWRYTITIHLFTSIPLQFTFCLKYTITYPLDVFLKNFGPNYPHLLPLPSISHGRPSIHHSSTLVPVRRPRTATLTPSGVRTPPPSRSSVVRALPPSRPSACCQSTRSRSNRDADGIFEKHIQGASSGIFQTKAFDVALPQYQIIDHFDFFKKSKFMYLAKITCNL